MNIKVFFIEDGNIAQLISVENVHYLVDSGAYEDINFNIMVILEGWEVKENIFMTIFGVELV